MYSPEIRDKYPYVSIFVCSRSLEQVIDDAIGAHPGRALIYPGLLEGLGANDRLTESAEIDRVESYTNCFHIISYLDRLCDVCCPFNCYANYRLLVRLKQNG